MLAGKKMADEEEELPDQKKIADDKCARTEACAKLFVEYEACSKRIEAKGHGECTGYYMDYLGAVDRCVRCALLCVHPHESTQRNLSRPDWCAGEGGDLRRDQVVRTQVHTPGAEVAWPIAAPRTGTLVRRSALTDGHASCPEL